jgi:hypothetical protein
VSDSNEPGELDDLDDLYNQGLLTDDEHQKARDRLSSRDGGSGRRGMRRLVPFWPVAALLVGVALIVFAILGTGGGKKTPATEPGIEVHGAVVISMQDQSALPDDPTVQQGAKFGTGGYNIGKGCHTVSGFVDIARGATVEITPSSGQKVSTKLIAGVYDSNADCVFGFTAAVPKEPSYTIRIAQRNPVPYQQSEIANPQLNL